MYFEAVDLLVNGIQSCFDQPGYQVYRQLENLLVTNKGEDVKEVPSQVCTQYGEDFDQKNLEVQLAILHQSVPAAACTNLQDIFQRIVSLSAAQLSLIHEVCTLVHLLLVIPATNAQSERSFSGLRQIKTHT